jgi:hypothetical protein
MASKLTDVSIFWREEHAGGLHKYEHRLYSLLQNPNLSRYIESIKSPSYIVDLNNVCLDVQNVEAGFSERRLSIGFARLDANIELLKHSILRYSDAADPGGVGMESTTAVRSRFDHVDGRDLQSVIKKIRTLTVSARNYTERIAAACELVERAIHSRHDRCDLQNVYSAIKDIVIDSNTVRAHSAGFMRLMWLAWGHFAAGVDANAIKTAAFADLALDDAMVKEAELAEALSVAHEMTAYAYGTAKNAADAKTAAIRKKAAADLAAQIQTAADLAAEGPTAEGPTAEEPTAEGPTAEGPTAEESTDGGE